MIFLKRAVLMLVVFLAAISVFTPVVDAQDANGKPQYFEAKVKNIYRDACPDSPDRTCQLMDILVLEDNNKTSDQTAILTDEGQTYNIDSTIWVTKESNGRYYVNLPNRFSTILVVAGIFLVLIVLLIGKKGLLAFVALIGSVSTIFVFFIPLIKAYPNQLVIIGLGTCLIILTINLLLGHGFNRNSMIAWSGSFACFLVALAVSVVLQKVFYVSGIGSEGITFLKLDEFTKNLNFANLFLVASLIIVCGALDDVTAAQATLVEELSKNPMNSRFWKLYNQSMKVGSEHIISMINTLFLVFLGTSLPTILLFQTQALQGLPIELILSRDDFTEEIVRSMLSSFAIVLAIPVTTLIAVIYYQQRYKNLPRFLRLRGKKLQDMSQNLLRSAPQSQDRPED